MPQAIDLTGYKTNEITVLRREGTKKGQATWRCVCSCGKEFVQYGGPLRSGKVKSCGHIYADKKRRLDLAYRTIAKGTHNSSFTRLYYLWTSIKGRCYQETSPSYRNYGARGIIMCDEWLKFENFKKWAIESGYDENAPRGVCTIDRIDPNGNYEPNNCRWANTKEQARNKRTTVFATINGQTKSLSEWSEESGLPRGLLYQRHKSGWDDKDLLVPSRSIIHRRK